MRFDLVQRAHFNERRNARPGYGALTVAGE